MSITYLALDKLDVTRALRVAVTGSVCGTGGVAREARNTSVEIHAHKVESTVKTAANVGDINVEGELVTEKLEALVLVTVHEVDTATNAGAVLTLIDELQRQRITAGGDTVGGLILCAIKAAVFSAGLAIRAERRVPGVAVVAVVRAFDGVRPAPVSVEGDGAGDVAAAAGSALLP